MKDIIIIGAGPGGLTAAIYAKRAGCDVAIFEYMSPGGQVMTTPDIENYPGFVGTGFDLAMKFYEQTAALGVEFQFESVKTIKKEDDSFTLTCESGNTFSAKCVIIASGASRRKLEIKGENEFTGRGVSYCATCDGAFYRDNTVTVIGGGNTALDDSLYLANFCQQVNLVHRRKEFRGDITTVEKIKANENRSL